MTTTETLLCAGCQKPVNVDDLAFETRAVTRRGKPWHRGCHLQTTKEYHLMDRLFKLQDDWRIEPETALADLIGDLGHFADLQGIDFEEAIRRGTKYWDEERVRPAESA
jgi:hypothetical protein